MTIKTLRQSNYKVRVIHAREYERRPLDKMSARTVLSSKGGSTRIDVTTPDGITETGIAQCSMLDSFNRKLGNQIALGRVIKALEAKGHTFASLVS